MRGVHTNQFREAYRKAIPMDCYGTTGEMAATVICLVPEDAGFRERCGAVPGWRLPGVRRAGRVNLCTSQRQGVSSCPAANGGD
jgi:hypothetical protein